MSDASTYRKNADELLKVAMLTTDLMHRGRLVSMAALWHNRAAEIERGVFPSAEDFAADSLDFPGLGPSAEPTDDPQP